MRARSAALLPGALLCAAVSLAAWALQEAERAVFGAAHLEALVIAILLGAAIRTAWAPPARFKPGIAFSAREVLELAVVLLGASVSFATVLAAGPGLLLGIAGVVAVAVCASYGMGRLLGVGRRVAVLVAAGNSICGNSAIAAVAPVIGADGDDVATSIAFTAVLGVVVVLGLPLLIPVLALTNAQYGVLAGLTVYAVPQVLAATLPVAALSAQIGTLVKLVRVLMLGPLVLVLSVLAGRRAGGGWPPLRQMVPWFILGFLVLAAARSLGLVPREALPVVAWLTTWLTVLAMAALGLGVDVRTVGRAGARVTATVVLSLVLLGLASLGLIRVLGVA